MKSTEQLTGLSSTEHKTKLLLDSLINLFSKYMRTKYPEFKAVESNVELINQSVGYRCVTVTRAQLRRMIMNDLDLTKKDTANSWIEVLCAKGYIEENTTTLTENNRADNNTIYSIIIADCYNESEELRIKQMDFALSQAEAKRQKEEMAQKKKSEIEISQRIMADLMNYSNQ